MTLFNDLNNLIVRYHFKPKTSLGQHFIIDNSVIELMVDEADLSKQDIVLEIGSGTGFLTKQLLQYSNVIGVEIDSNLIELLEEEFYKELKSGKFTLIKKDFTKLKNEEIPSFTKIVSCPPYLISSDIMYRVFELMAVRNFSKAVFLLQKDFVEKLIAEPGFPDYTAVSFLTNYFFEPKPVKTITAGSFFPRPRVPSKIISLKPNKRFGIAENELFFIKFVKEIFRYKNKNLSKSLMHSYPFLKQNLKLGKKDLLDFLSAHFLKTQKVSLIEPEDLISFYNELVLLK